MKQTATHSQGDSTVKAGDEDRYVFVEFARCPECEATEHKVYETRWEDGSRRQRVRCKTCGHKFFIVSE